VITFDTILDTAALLRAPHADKVAVTLAWTEACNLQNTPQQRDEWGRAFLSAPHAVFIYRRQTQLTRRFRFDRRRDTQPQPLRDPRLLRQISLYPGEIH
jgi:hypothetical protein